MACNDYSNGSAPQVVFSMGTLPPGFCPDGYQALFDAIATYLAGTLPANFSTFLIRDSTPAVTDRDKLWLSVDPANCRPLGFYLYSTTHAAWVPVAQQVWNGDAAGTANALTCTFSPTLKYLTAGHMFIVKASATANTAAATLNPSSLGAKAIKKQGGQALEGGEILPNALLLLTWRSDYFELLNPAPSSASLMPVNRLINGSFETDSDADGQPDGWEFDANGGTPGGATGAISTSTVGHGAKSYAINGAANTSGSLAMLDMQPCKGNNSPTDTDGELMLLSFWQRTSDTLNDDTIQVSWYDASTPPALISSSTIWAWDTTAAANTWKRFYAPMVPATGARFFKLTIIGNTTGGGIGISYYDGLAVETVTFKRKVSTTTAGTYPWVCPAGVFSVRATCVGAGGGGAGGAVGLGGGGGGGGGVAVSIVNTTPLTTYSVVVGAAGAAGLAGGAGGAGGNSSFNGVVGNGGVGGIGPGVLGTGGGGTGQFVTNGGDGTGPVGATGGNGGSSASFGGSGTAATAGCSPGGGGAGGTGAVVGLAGGTGSVTIEY